MRTQARRSGGTHPPDPRLTNPDLAPTPVDRRTWSVWNMAALWVGMVVCVPTYMLAGGLVDLGMSWWQAVATVCLGNLVVLVPMVLNGHPGTRYGIPFPVLASLVALSIATLSTNLAANVVSPANAIFNLAPERFSFRAGALVTAGLGVAIFPWKLIESTQGYIFTWLIGYSALLGPIGGILLADYYLVRRTRLQTDDLYRRGGVYEYRGGYNPRALVALAAGVAPNVPGFLAAAGFVDSVPPLFSTLYTYAWFVGLALAGGVYWLLMRDEGDPQRERSGTPLSPNSDP